MNPSNEISTAQKILSLADNMNSANATALKAELIKYINDLINNDFNALIQLLYRIDVDEHQLKEKLQAEEGSNSATLIAEMIIKRQRQKQELARQFRNIDSTSEEEKW
ncbi:MAG: hypothetical protein ABI683_07975 [Ginsengibacter sp.]